MFSKLSLLALVAPLVSALSMTAPTNPTSGGSVTITWTAVAGDPDTFSLELTNPIFNNAFAIANNVDTSLGTITVQLPIVPVGDQYTIEAVNIGDINQVYAETSGFSVGATTTTSSASGSVPTTTRASTAGTSTGSVVSTRSVNTSTGSVSTPATATSTSSATGTSSAAAIASTGAAVSSRVALTNAGGYAVLMLSAVAGAAAFVL